MELRGSSITLLCLFNGPAPSATRLAIAAPPMPAAEDGLWPDYNDGTWPSCCYRSQFDVKEISTLLDALEKYWPSLYCGKSSTCFSGKGLFWAHEVDIVLYFLYVSKLFSTKAKKLIIASFLNLLMAKLGCDLEVGIAFSLAEKHGTCSSPVIRDEYSYFITTLNVYFKYNVTKILNEAGYVPSNSERYPLGGIVSAIENSFRATPEVICSKEAVEEIRLCFFKDFKPRNCLASKTSCPKYVSLPAYVSMGKFL
ncbi:hypothetical protein Gohar_015843 [Gossypium harknessii]|uniref:Uncharacterized protein n=1 Tax=Gossypium harknessii TaxID=34285 RepID=A0A7J9G1H8_9ROSI|nr:hypothetical protein [Gossypium harknessii]